MPTRPKESALWHLATTHGWRQFWLFGMTGEQAADSHSRQFPDCPWRPEATLRPEGGGS